MLFRSCHTRHISWHQSSQKRQATRRAIGHPAPVITEIQLSFIGTTASQPHFTALGDPSVEMPALEDKVSAIDASVGSKSASTSNATAAASMNDDIAINSVVNGVVVKGGWDELPHNMGTLATKPSDVAAEEQADTKPAKPRGKKLSPAKVIDGGNGDEGAADRAGNDSGDEAADMPAKPEPNKRAPRKKVAAKEPTQNDDVDMEDALQEADGEVDAKPAPKKRAPRKRAAQIGRASCRERVF